MFSAALRPDAIARTTNDAPIEASPAAKTFPTVVLFASSTAMLLARIEPDSQIADQPVEFGMNESHRQQYDIGLYDLRFPGMFQRHLSRIVLFPFDAFGLDADQHAVFPDKAVRCEVPTAFAAFLMRRGGFQHLRIHRPRSIRIAAYRRLGHDLDLGNPDGALTDGRADTIRSGIAAADHQYPFSLCGNPLVLRNLCAGIHPILLLQQLQREMRPFQVAPLHRKISRHPRRSSRKRHRTFRVIL